MTKTWVILGERTVETLEQDNIPVVHTRGKAAELFPLYIQCRSAEDANEISRIHEPILKLSAVCSTEEQLASGIHTSLRHLHVMSDINVWFSLLNGRSFRGILHSATDFDSQTRDFAYPSWRRAESFWDALLIMVLKGKKEKLAEIKALPPSVSSAADDLDHLTISSLSTRDEDELNMSPSTSACGRKFVGLPTKAFGKSSSSSTSPRAPEEYKFKFRASPMPTNYSQWPSAKSALTFDTLTLLTLLTHFKPLLLLPDASTDTYEMFRVLSSTSGSSPRSARK